MNLYSKLVPAGRFSVVVQSGFDEVYCEADSAGAFAVSQLPSCEMEPTILIVCPTTVVAFSLKVSATVEAVAHPVAVAVAAADVFVELGGGFGPPDPEPVMVMSAQVK